MTVVLVVAVLALAVAVAVLARRLVRSQARARTLTARVVVAERTATALTTSVRQASDGLQALLSGLVAAEEATRGQLAAELHDTVAQSLGAARGLLAGTGDGTPEGRARDHVEDAEEQVRAVMARARPPALAEHDLGGAVALLREDLCRRYGLNVVVSWPREDVALTVTAATVIYRFFSEGLLNVVKHADVDEARVRLEVPPSGDGLCASVEDDGPGFEPELVVSTGGRHVGLLLLGERARLAGGRLEVGSSASGGTRLVLHLPSTALGARTSLL